jgi:hypothetical protein
MGYQKRGRIEAHDAAGYETDMIDFAAEYGDGYGNNVAHGDLSVQRMVEGGCRDTVANVHEGWPPATGPRGYDKQDMIGGGGAGGAGVSGVAGKSIGGGSGGKGGGMSLEALGGKQAPAMGSLPASSHSPGAPTPMGPVMITPLPFPLE